MAEHGIVSEAPAGFTEAMGEACHIPASVLEEMCCDALKFLKKQIPSLPASSYVKKLPAEDNRSASEIRNILNALQYLFKAAQQAKLSEDAVSKELSGCSALTDAARTAILHAWHSQAMVPVISVDGMKDFHIGQLEDVQWKLGMATTSDSCRNLNAPYIILLLTVSDSDGKPRCHCIELSLAEFRNFSNQLKDIARHMETV